MHKFNLLHFGYADSPVDCWIFSGFYRISILNMPPCNLLLAVPLWTDKPPTCGARFIGDNGKRRKLIAYLSCRLRLFPDIEK